MANPNVHPGFALAATGDLVATLITGSDYGGTPKAYAPKVDSSGNLYTLGTATPSATTAAASSQYSPVTSVVTAAFIKASAGNVLHILVTNTNAAVRWFQLHNKATIPLATEVPLHTFIIPAGTATVPGYVEFMFRYGAAFSTGIGFAVSTTQGTFTDAATASEHTVHVEYI